MEWWEQLRAHFPVLGRRGYFFAGDQAPMAVEVGAELLRLVALWRDEIWHFEETEWARQDEIQGSLGRLFRCDRARVVITENTSHGMNIAASMVLAKWLAEGASPGNVVLHGASHPAGSYVWLNAVRLGAPLELRWSRDDGDGSASSPVVDLLDDRTLAVVASHVDHMTGARLDVASLAPSARAAGAALLLDAAQTAGALDLENEVATCDFVAMPGYKWLFGPPGTGYLVVGADWIESIGPPFVGWGSQRDRAVMDAHRLDLAPGGSGFRLGVPNYMTLAASAAALAIMLEAGPERVEERIRLLTSLFLDGVAAHGLPCVTPEAWEQRAGVLSLPSSDPRRAMSVILEQGSEVGSVTGLVRVDIHAYNTEAEIDDLIGHLASYYAEYEPDVIGSGEARR